MAGENRIGEVCGLQFAACGLQSGNKYSKMRFGRNGAAWQRHLAMYSRGYGKNS